jgi:hypothetical protein
MNRRIGFQVQVSAMPQVHSLDDWCGTVVWLHSGAPEDPNDVTVIEMHTAEALYSTVKSLMHVIWTQDHDAQHAAVHWKMQIAVHWRIRG